VAALDVGTNTIRCIVVEAAGAEGYRVLDDEKATVRLGEGLHATGRICDAAWKRAREALRRMRKILDGFGVEAVEAVATSAVRRAVNGAEFLRAMEHDAGIRIRVISGEEEAELAAVSALHHFRMAETNCALIDIGGGSVEVVTATGSHIEEIFSLELGSVVLTERFISTDPPVEGELRALRKHIRRTLASMLGGEEASPQFLVGSGGTMTAIAAMAMARRKERYDSVHGYEVLRSEVVHLWMTLARRTRKERRAVAGLSPERADIIVAGVAVVDELMRHFGVNRLKINERGIREGLVLRALRQRGLIPDAGVPRDWRASVEEVARSCQVEDGHARQVARLSLSIFDALAGPFSLEGRSRDLLEAAALLHDVGYFISYDKHHKHSYHLIRHAPLSEFTPREREIVANVARYHRGALPKRKHGNFGDLAQSDRELVRRLGGILRLADGLDRRRSAHVARLEIERRKRRLVVLLHGAEELSVELYGAMEKKDLLEQAFGLEVELSAVEPARPASEAGPQGA
jgi:exopolyphosphatase/guanosine-5'-triphosphate,3'-diphosphate pyrophosphatase